MVFKFVQHKRLMKKEDRETKRRLDAVLRGAFAGAPTKLKDIPKKSGESRAAKPRSSVSRPRPAEL
jgi:hypothetical protein